jgi:hypothetical protein
MLVNSYFRLEVANPGPSRFLGGFCGRAPKPVGKPAAAPRVGKPSRPTTALPAVCAWWLRPDRRCLATPSCNVTLQRDLTLSHFCVVHLLHRGGPPNPFPSSWPSQRHVRCSPRTARSMQPKPGGGVRAAWLNRLRDTLAFGNTGEYNCVGCLYLLGELRFEEISAQNRPA